MKILITGASGFVGRALCTSLIKKSMYVRAVLRSIHKKIDNPEVVVIDNIDLHTNWIGVLHGVDVVVHLAARVHVMKEEAVDPLFEFRKVNVDGTINLAQQAFKAGVHRFVFISSIKVNGEFTNLGHPFTADQISVPSDPYGISKYEAELGLKVLAEETGMEVVIIRPPLVYGPGVKANFLSMMKWMQRGIWLPFGGVTKNRRSFVFIDNLVDMIIICINHPAAANQTFLVSDDEDLSTAGLLKRTALALRRPSRLIAVPAILITFVLRLFGRPDISQRLCGSLQVDIQKTKDLLDWSPPVSVDDGLRQTAAYFLEIQV
jgi:nucleoside-diphosphate-sugar epimerase